MTVEQGLRAEFHDRPKVLARALRAAREQGTIGKEYWGFSEDSVFNWDKSKERWLYWNGVTRGFLYPDQCLPEDYVDVEETTFGAFITRDAMAMTKDQIILPKVVRDGLVSVEDAEISEVAGGLVLPDVVASERKLKEMADLHKPSVENGRSEFYIAWRLCYEWLSSTKH